MRGKLLSSYKTNGGRRQLVSFSVKEPQNNNNAKRKFAAVLWPFGCRIRYPLPKHDPLPFPFGAEPGAVDPIIALAGDEFVGRIGVGLGWSGLGVGPKAPIKTGKG